MTRVGQGQEQDKDRSRTRKGEGQDYEQDQFKSRTSLGVEDEKEWARSGVGLAQEQDKDISGTRTETRTNNYCVNGFPRIQEFLWVSKCVSPGRREASSLVSKTGFSCKIREACSWVSRRVSPKYRIDPPGIHVSSYLRASSLHKQSSPSCVSPKIEEHNFIYFLNMLEKRDEIVWSKTTEKYCFEQVVFYKYH